MRRRRPTELDVFRRFFGGNPAAFAQQLSPTEAAERDGGTLEDYPKGRYVPHRRPLTDDDLDRHLKGEWTLGIYLVRPGTNDTRLLAIDIDTGEQAPDDTIQLVSVLRGLFHGQWLVEYSGRKGYHVWFFLETWMPAAVVRRAGQALLHLAGLNPATEVYPRQDQVADLGSLIKLPLGLHQVSGQWSYFVDQGWPTDEVQPVTRAEVEALAAQLPEPEQRTPQEPGEANPNAPLPPCMTRLVTHGVRHGLQHDSLVSLALECKHKGMDEAEALELVLQAHDGVEQPGPERNVRRLVAQVYAAPHLRGLKCSRLHLHDLHDTLCSSACPRYQPAFGPARQGGP